MTNYRKVQKYRLIKELTVKKFEEHVNSCLIDHCDEEATVIGTPFTVILEDKDNIPVKEMYICQAIIWYEKQEINLS
jgi:hypothetical protein